MMAKKRDRSEISWFRSDLLLVDGCWSLLLHFELGVDDVVLALAAARVAVP
jgi:hypothetical protein